ncbi:MAG: metal-sensitive transcriptional regulator, partial [Bacillota bacterium]
MNSTEVSVEGKEEILKRLRRIEGQVKGIQRMIEEDQDCLKILTQIAAVKAAVQAVGVTIVERNTVKCLESACSQGRQDEYVKHLVEVLMRFA